MCVSSVPDNTKQEEFFNRLQKNMNNTERRFFSTNCYQAKVVRGKQNETPMDVNNHELLQFAINFVVIRNNDNPEAAFLLPKNIYLSQS